MKIAIIYGIVMTILVILSFVISYVTSRIKDEKFEKELESIRKDYEKKIADLKLLESAKDKLKVEADEKKRDIRTGNDYDNLINGAKQLCDKP